MADTPIKYIVKEKSLIGNELFEAGAEVTLPEGTLPAENLEPMCERGQAEYQKYVASNAARVARMKDAFSEDSSANVVLAAEIGKAVAAAMAEQRAEMLEASKPAKPSKKADPELA
jgi:hypothetical protein